jgi:hypothetical protein
MVLSIATDGDRGCTGHLDKRQTRFSIVSRIDYPALVGKGDSAKQTGGSILSHLSLGLEKSSEPSHKAYR